MLKHLHCDYAEFILPSECEVCAVYKFITLVEYQFYENYPLHKNYPHILVEYKATSSSTFGMKL